MGYSYKTINHANILNLIRKNIALMSRNVDNTTLINVTSPLDFIIVKDGNYTSKDYRIDFSWNASTNINGKHSVIVIGGDIILDQTDINALNWTNENIGLIALKDESGSGGNIIITNNVKRIYAYLYAEGSVYSGEKANDSSPIVPYTNDGVWNIPK